MTMKKIAETNYKGSIAIEAMNWEYTELTPEKFLQEAFERAKRLEQLRNNSIQAL